MFALEKRKLSAALRKTKSIERYGLYVARALHQKGRPLAVGVSNHTHVRPSMTINATLNAPINATLSC